MRIQNTIKMAESTCNPSDALALSFNGENISKLLRADGPIVSCVLLHAKHTVAGVNGNNDDDNDVKSPITDGNDEDENTAKIVLEDQISQIMVDTTPKKSMVSQILGGPFTFLGQYEEEGVVLMVRRQLEIIQEDNSSSNDESKDNHNPLKSEERNDDNPIILNPHQLQPPLHDLQVYGDILIMRVAPCDDDGDGDCDDGDDENASKKDDEGEVEEEKAVSKPTESNTDYDDENKPEHEQQRHSSTPQDSTIGSISTSGSTSTSTTCTRKDPTLLSNEEFFLNYTKEEYVKFALRTDIKPTENKDATVEEDGEALGAEDGSESEEEDENDGEDDDDDDDDGDEEYTEQFDEDDEDCQISVMNLILGQIIKRFREENGRGPGTEELLTMRSALAEKLGIVVEEDDIEGGDVDDNEAETEINDSDDNNASESATKKRKSDDNGEEGREKRVKFTNKDDIKLIPGIEHPDIVPDDDEGEI